MSAVEHARGLRDKSGDDRRQSESRSASLEDFKWDLLSDAERWGGC